MKLIPQSMARHCNALPIAIQESSLIVAMAEPQNLQFLDELRFKSGKMKIVPRLGFRSEIALAIDRHYGVLSTDSGGPLAPLASSLEDQGMEFISFNDTATQHRRHLEVELCKRPRLRKKAVKAR